MYSAMGTKDGLRQNGCTMAKLITSCKDNGKKEPKSYIWDV